jgi:acetyl esterase
MTSNPLEMLSGILQSPPKTAQDMRNLLDLMAGFINTELPEVGAIHEAVAICEGVTADVIEPVGEGPHPVLVYLHGGGWICGSPTSHRKLACRFAEAGYLVFNVDYRLAPEHPFPAPLEDSIEAIRFAAREAQRWNGDASRLAVGGDSAGGNLAAAAAAAQADDPARPRAALLLYGVFDFATMGELPSMPGMDSGPMKGFGAKILELMVDSYLGADSDDLARDPRVSPVRAADRLPPCHVMVGSADPLMSQADALVAELEKAGIEHEYFVDADMPHGYAQFEMLPPARPAIDRMIAFLDKHLSS